jgi:hypothetical protein
MTAMIFTAASLLLLSGSLLVRTPLRAKLLPLLRSAR